MKKRGLTDILSQALPDQRRDNRHIPFDILLCLAVAAKLKRKGQPYGCPLCSDGSGAAGRAGLEPLGQCSCTIK